MRLKDIIVLKYAPNPCYVQVSDFTDELRRLIEVNIHKGTYTFVGHKDDMTFFTDIPIGVTRRAGDVLGVYDRTNTKHLEEMVRTATETIRSWYPVAEDA